MTLQTLLGFACLFIGALLAACSPATAPTSAEPDPGLLPLADSAADVPVRGVAWKLDLLATCYNDADQRAHDTVARYLNWIGDPGSGPTGTEPRVLGIPELPATLVDKCSDDLHLASTEGPPMRELDLAARAYLAALRELSVQILPLHRYYRRKAWRDDGFKHARALHGKVMESARQFARASNAFSRVLEGQRAAGRSDTAAAARNASRVRLQRVYSDLVASIHRSD